MPASTSEVANPIVRTSRDKEPAHFIFEIESFEALRDSIAMAGSERIESSEFEAEGKRWALVVYPNGNKKHEGNGYVSLYLKMIDRPVGGEYAYTSFKFFIFDKIRETYTIIQDVRERRFDAGHLEWGIPRALPVSEFIDRTNGWLVNDSITFGVELYLIKENSTTSRLSFTKPRYSYTSQWQVPDFSSNTNNVTSAAFTLQGLPRRFFLRIQKREENGGVLSPSLYLGLENATDLIGGKKLLVHCEIVIKDSSSRNPDKKTVIDWFDSAESERHVCRLSTESSTVLSSTQQTRSLSFESAIQSAFFCTDSFEED